MQHVAVHIFAERGVRLGRVAVIQSQLDEVWPEGIIDDQDASGRMSVPAQKQLGSDRADIFRSAP